MESNKIKLGQRKSTLLRYKAIVEEYNAHCSLDIPTTVIYRKYIQPKFFISLRTLNTILSTPINKELAEIERLEGLNESL
jgi:hypothetical protein